jgi:DNA-binding NarL/FixJ family response regulator
MADEGSAVRILLVEDQSSFREALAFIFERQPEFTVVGQAGTLAEARGLLKEDIDVAVVDLALPDGDGVDLIRDLHRSSPDVMALVLSASLDQTNSARAVAAGAAGVLDKLASIDDILDAVRRLRAGEALLSKDEVIDMLRLVADQREQDQEARRAMKKLTPRERELLQALAEGFDSEEIARRLHITPQTERNHMRKVFAKLGVHSRLQALVFAVRHGLVEIR